jgi:hypothetical protein
MSTSWFVIIQPWNIQVQATYVGAGIKVDGGNTVSIRYVIVPGSTPVTGSVNKNYNQAKQIVHK